MTKSNQRIKLIALTGVFAALVYVVTMIHIPTGNGYTHAGDGVIYLAACLLPTPYAVAASAIGGALADGLSGFAEWLPATLVIKAITALFFSSKAKKVVCLRNVLGIIPSLLLCVFGYSLYEAVFLLGNLSWSTIIVAFTQFPAYTVQVTASSVLYIALGIVIDKAGIKNKLI